MAQMWISHFFVLKTPPENCNSRSKAVGVSSTPGFTKAMQEIHLDKTVRQHLLPIAIVAVIGG